MKKWQTPNDICVRQCRTPTNRGDFCATLELAIGRESKAIIWEETKKVSYWTDIRGIIQVMPMGRTQPEKEYILNTVLEHLPRVSGSEKDMDVHVIKRSGYNGISAHDEFGCRTNNLVNWDGDKTRRGYLRTQDTYFLIVDGELRDCHFTEAYRDFLKWLCRLAKRVYVTGVLVNVDGDDGCSLIQNDRFDRMWEEPSYGHEKKAPHPDAHNWCEYLMWGHDNIEPGG